MDPRVLERLEKQRSQVRDSFKGLDTNVNGVSDNTFTANPQKSRARASNLAYMGLTLGQDVTELGKVYDSIRPHFAKTVLGAAEDPGDEGLYGLIAKQFDREESVRTEMAEFSAAARMAAFGVQLDPEGADVLPPTPGTGAVPWPIAYDLYRRQRTDIEFTEKKYEDLRKEAFQQSYQIGVAESSEIKTVAKDLLSQLEIKEGVSSGQVQPEVFQKLELMDRDQRHEIYTILERMADDGKVDKDWKENLYKATIREFGRTYGNLGLNVQHLRGRIADIRNGNALFFRERPTGEETQEELLGKLISVGELTNRGNTFVKNVVPVRDSEREELKDAAERADVMLDVHKELRDIRHGVVNPIRTDSAFAEKVLYPSIASLSASATAFSVYTWPIFIVSNAEERMTELQSRGVAKGDARSLSLISSIIEAPIERFQLQGVVGKGAARALGKWQAGLKARVGSFGFNLGAQLTTQNAQELVQDFTPFAVQSLASLLKEEVPGVDWDKELAPFMESRIDTFLALLPMVFVGAGGGSVRDYFKGKEMLANKAALESLGVTPEDSEEISKARARGDIDGATEMLHKAKRGPIKPEAFQEKHDEYAELMENGILGEPEVSPLDGGRAELLYPNGEVATFENVEQAYVAAQNFKDTRAIEFQDNFKELLSSFESSTGTEIKTEAFKKTLQTMVDSGAITAQTARDRIRALSLETGVEHDQNAFDKFRIDAQNEATFKEGVFKNVVRLFDTKNPFAVIEDVSEGFFKNWIRNGERPQLQRWLNDYQTKTGDVLMKDVETGTDAELIEAMSALATSYYSGKVRNGALSTGIKKLLQAFQEYFRYVFDRAARLQKQFDEGGLSPEFEAKLAESVGLTAPPVKAERTVESARNEIIREVTRQQKLDDLSDNADQTFSIRRTVGAFHMAGIRSYTGANYARFNDALVGERGAPEHILKAVALAISAVPESPGKHFHGTDRDAVYQFFKNAKVGDSFYNKTFLSTSKARSQATGFGRRVVLTIKGVTGRDVENRSRHRHEQEVIYLPNTKFNIEEIKRVGSDNFVTLREVEAAPELDYSQYERVPALAELTAQGDHFVSESGRVFQGEQLEGGVDQGGALDFLHFLKFSTSPSMVQEDNFGQRWRLTELGDGKPLDKTAFDGLKLHQQVDIFLSVVLAGAMRTKLELSDFRITPEGAARVVSYGREAFERDEQAGRHWPTTVAMGRPLTVKSHTVDHAMTFIPSGVDASAFMKDVLNGVRLESLGDPDFSLILPFEIYNTVQNFFQAKRILIDKKEDFDKEPDVDYLFGDDNLTFSIFPTKGFEFPAKVKNFGKLSSGGSFLDVNSSVKLNRKRIEGTSSRDLLSFPVPGSGSESSASMGSKTGTPERDVVAEHVKLQDGDVAHRIHNISIPDKFRGRRLGQALRLAHYQNAEKAEKARVFFYNSQQSPEAARSTRALAEKGLIELVELTQNRNASPTDPMGAAITYLTDKGRDTKPESIISDPIQPTFSISPRQLNSQIEQLFRPPDFRETQYRRVSAKLIALRKSFLKKKQLAERNLRALGRLEIAEGVAQFEALLMALPVSVRGKVSGAATLVEKATDKGKLSFLLNRLDRIDKILDDYIAERNRDKIRRLVDRVKAKKRNGKLVSSAGPEVARQLMNIEAVMNMSTVDLDAHITGLRSVAADPENAERNEEKIILAERFGALDKMDAHQSDMVWDELGDLIDAGRTKWRIHQEQRRNFNDNMVQAAKEEAKAPLTAPSSEELKQAEVEATKMWNRAKNWAKDFAVEHLSFEQTLTTVFGFGRIRNFFGRNAIKAKNAFVSQEVARRLDLEAFMINEMGLTTGRARDNFFVDLKSRNANSGVFRTTKEEMNLSADEAIYLTMLWDQIRYRENLEKKNEIDQNTIDQIEDFLSPEEKQYRAYLTGILQSDAEYNRVNAVYRELNGVDLPRESFYAPASVELPEGKDLQSDPFDQENLNTGLAAGFTKLRTSHSLKLREVGASVIFWAHAQAQDYYTSHGLFARDVRSILLDGDLLKGVKTTKRKGSAKALAIWAENFHNNGLRRAAGVLAGEQFLERLRRTTVAIGLAYNIGSIMKQWTAGIASLMEMPAHEFAWSMGKLLLNPTSMGHIWKSSTIRNRLLNGFSIEMQTALRSANASPGVIMRGLKVGLQTIGLADAMATTVSATIAYDYHLRQAKRDGLTGDQAHEFAMQEMDMTVARTAQPTQNVDRSLIELRSDGNAALRLYIMFKSEMRQKLALTLMAVRNTLKEPGHRTDAFRVGFVTWFAMPIMTVIATKVYRDVFRDGEDDDENDLTTERFLAAIVAGQSTGLFYFGEALELAALYAFDQPAWTRSDNVAIQAVQQSARTFKKVTDGEFGKEDILRDWNSVARNMGLLLGGGAGSALGVSSRVIRDLKEGSEYAGETLDIDVLQFGKPPTTELDRALDDIEEGEDVIKDARSETLARKRDIEDAAEASRVAGLSPRAQKLESQVERALKLQVGTGSRARAMRAILDTLSEDEQRDLISRLRKDKKLSTRVLRQIQTLNKP